MRSGFQSDETGSTPVRSARRHGTPTGRAAKLKPWNVWVRLPPVLLKESSKFRVPGSKLLIQPGTRNLELGTEKEGETPVVDWHQPVKLARKHSGFEPHLAH